MKKRFFTLAAAVAMTLASAQAQEIATWKGFRTSAATFTFDDGCSTQKTYAVPLFDKYGYKASFYVVTNWANGNGMSWSDFKTLANNGHEVGSHSDTHANTMPDSEISSSKSTIEKQIGKSCLTITYPNCNEPSESTLRQYYIGGRVCDGQVMGSTPSNYYRISSIICGNTGSYNSSSALCGKMNEAANKKGWVVFLIHEVQSGSGYSPTATDAISGALDYASKNDSKFWIATFRDAILYSKERNSAKVTVTSTSSTDISLSLTDNLDNSIYNYPLSLRYKMPDGWSEVTVSQNDEELTSEVKDGYIYFDAVPDNGTITITSGTVAIADPTVKFTSPTKEENWCTDSTYNIAWNIDGEAASTYSLIWNCGEGEEVSISNATASSEWSNDEGTFSWSVSNILSDDGANGESSRWGSKSNADEWVELTLSKQSTVGGFTIDEFEEYGTVSSFEMQYDDNGTWKTAYTGTTIGQNFSASFASPVSTTKIRFYIKSASGVNINYIALSGVGSQTLKTDIAASGSFSWKPTTAGTGTLTIAKASGKVLATSSSIKVASCGGSSQSGGSTSGGSSTSSECSDGQVYTGPSCDGTGTGAYYTGVYRNLFTEYLGKTQTEVDNKIASIWKHFFENSSTKVYYETNDGMAYIYDTGNEDVRTEGMSYGMMICVQLDHQTQFDKIWKWAKKYMQYPSGNEKEGLFAWQCNTDGSIKGTSCAPDGEAYFLTSLFFASHRWGNDGEINYEKEAQYLIKELLDKPNRQAGSVSPIFNMSNYLITFGETSYGFTDPSYNLPGFLELWARWTDTNKDFWAKTADAARDLLYKSSNSTTGLFPDYSNFDGSPYYPSWAGYDTQWYKYDAIRCAMNVGMDYHWFGTDSRQPGMMSKLLNFFKNDGFSHGYFTVDGSQKDGSYSEGQKGANGVGVFALSDSEKDLGKTYINTLWNTSAPSGQWRYYNGMVYMLSMLNASGNFKIYKPAPEVEKKNLNGVGSVEFNGKTYTESTQFCTMIDCIQYDVTITVTSSTGIDEAVANKMSITPNPASTSFTVEGIDNVRRIEVYNLSGIRLICNEESNTTSVSSLADGTYIVRVLSENGVNTSKIIVSKQ